MKWQSPIPSFIVGVRCWASTVLLSLALALISFSASAQHAQRQYLSGHGKDDAVPWKFFCTGGLNSGHWSNLPVPSCWELHGFGHLNYHRDATNPPPEQGLYKHEFKVQTNWSGQTVFLVFEGVMTDASASLNGQSLEPTHQGAYYRFKYDVTKLLKFGQANLLEVKVAKHSANASVNNAERKGDYWMYGGIFRPVYLEAVPLQFIERVAIDARADGAFAMDVFVGGHGEATSVEAQILSLQGKPLGEPFSASLRGDKAVLKVQAPSPRQWTAETPNLYKVEVRLKNGSKLLHEYEQRFGFRTMEVREGDGLYVNGRRVILKGCNRHSFWPDSGRCLSEAVHRLDIETMKDMNMNAVRMSHYPPDAEFLDLCDELGLYVLDELAGWHWNYDTPTGTQRVQEMVTRDVNHPSILFWDNGNEGGFNTNLDRLFPELDPQHRHVLHPWSLFGGVNTGHYKRYEEAQLLCAGPDIYMPTEFNHGLYDGGAGAGLENYWDLMLSSKVLGGGFIWAFLDEGVKRPETGKIDVAGNEAPDGIVGPYREKEASFYAIKEIWSPLVLKERELPPDFNGVLTLENRYSFTDARDCRFEWALRKYYGPKEKKTGFITVASGRVESPAIAPASTGTLKLALPASWQSADALSLCASDPSGRELWTWVWPLPGLASSLPNPESAATRSSPKAEVIDNVNTLTVKAGKLSLLFDKSSGRLSEIQRAGKRFSLSNGPRTAAGTAKLSNLEHAVEGNDAVITAQYTGDLTQVQWHVQPNGWLRCDYSYTAQGPKDFFGVVFDYPEELVQRKKWLGLGPYRVWKNRLRGATLNVWENNYNNTITGWADWNYPEFKGCFAGVRWMLLQTKEGPITVVPGKDEYVQVLNPAFPPANLVGKAGVNLPPAGLAFLHAIPPIGSKFQNADRSGPDGQPTVGQGEYHGSVAFWFGKLP